MEARRIEAVQDAAAELGATVVLQDARSLIAYPDRRVFINTSDSPSLGGLDEVLAGVVAALVDLGLPVREAVGRGWPPTAAPRKRRTD